MEFVNGDFIMKGCTLADPGCLNSFGDLLCYVHKIGFVPLFSNDIPGFSVEEHVPVERWWAGDPTSDPWEWRQLAAAEPEIAYGKFFDRKAGFIAKEWFPAFANYRRNGYDFDALYEDGLASLRAKKIMDVFGIDDDGHEDDDGRAAGKELLSNEVKVLAGFGRSGNGKTGEKNYEGVLTELQMQTYLIISGFRQKRNKKGQPYGWHIALLETPETKWGYDEVTREYSLDPQESRDKIVRQIRRFFPDAEDRKILKV